jgi:hypothetical protein
MQCPECDSEIGAPRLGNFKCPECKSRLLIFPTEAKPNTGKAVEGETAGYLNGRTTGKVTHKYRTQGPQEELRFFCAGCSQRLNPALSRTGRILEGLQFMRSRETRIEIPLLGELNTWERSYVLTGDPKQIQVTKTRPFIKYNKGFLCDSCSALTGTWKHTSKIDGQVKEYPLVILDGLKPSGHTELPQREHLDPAMPNRAQEFNDSLVRHTQQADNHWLNVGRKR